LKDGVSATLNTPAIPDGKLKGILEKFMEKIPSADGGQTQIIETGGQPISQGYNKSDLFPTP
jgi:hypothetical protein